MRAVQAILALVVLALAGCGGGGGGSASPPYVPASTPTPVPTASPVGTPTGSPAPAPTVGYLAVSGSSFSGTTSSAARAVTLVAISGNLIPRPTSPAFVPTTIRVDVAGGATQTLARRATDLISNS